MGLLRNHADHWNYPIHSRTFLSVEILPAQEAVGEESRRDSRGSNVDGYE